MDNSDDYLGFAIGHTPQTLVYLHQMGIPMIDQPIFNPHAVYVQRADGTRVGHGYAACQWIWDVISGSALSQLLEFIGDNDYAYVYIRTKEDKGLTVQPAEAFKVYYALMYRPIINGQEGVPIARSPYAYQSVQIQFHRLMEQPGYL